MIANLKPYPAYKDSGTPWLEDVPEYWEVRRLKSSVEHINDQTNGKHPDDLYIALEHVESWTGRLQAPCGNVEFDSQVKRFRAGDVLFGKLRPYLAKVVRPKQNGVCVGEFFVLRPKYAVTARYLELVFRSAPAIDFVNSSTYGAKMPRANWNFVGGMLFPHPSLPEQTAIVRVLDWAEARIKRMIWVREKRIKLLKEYKQALIHQAVTGQIDVRTGKPYPNYKDLGVEWLGKVPEHWEVRKLKYVVSFTGGGTPSKAVSAFWEGTIPWVSPKDMKSAVIVDTLDHISEGALDSSATNLIPEGAVLLVVRSGILRHHIPVATNAGPVALNQDMKALRPKPNLLTANYLYLIISGCESALLNEWTKQGATVESIEHEFLANSRLPLPPLHEQTAIVEFLDEETGIINDTIMADQRVIRLLKELRTRLIADVVTGKVDVREVATKLPDEPPEEAAEVLAEKEIVEDDGVGDEPGLETVAGERER